MMTRGRVTDELALAMLRRDGIAAIWNLNLAAAEAHRAGYLNAAEAIVEIAEAAEDAWLRMQSLRPVMRRALVNEAFRLAE